jgi:hypothetical protein
MVTEKDKEPYLDGEGGQQSSPVGNTALKEGMRFVGFEEESEVEEDEEEGRVIRKRQPPPIWLDTEYMGVAVGVLVTVIIILITIIMFILYKNATFSPSPAGEYLRDKTEEGWEGEWRGPVRAPHPVEELYSQCSPGHQHCSSVPLLGSYQGSSPAPLPAHYWASLPHRVVQGEGWRSGLPPNQVHSSPRLKDMRGEQSRIVYNSPLLQEEPGSIREKDCRVYSRASLKGEPGSRVYGSPLHLGQQGGHIYSSSSHYSCPRSSPPNRRSQEASPFLRGKEASPYAAADLIYSGQGEKGGNFL